MSGRVPLVLSVLLLASACEVIADFDPKKLEMDRTIGPVPVTELDGAVPLLPEASVEADGALIKPPVADAETPAPADAGDRLDAASDAAAAAPDAAGADSGNDAAQSGDIGFADASAD